MKMPEPKAWAIFTPEGNARMWSTFQPHVQKLADAEGLTVTKLYDKQALIDLLEAAAALIAPKRQRPCDCEVCDCGNRDDAQRVAEWDADNTAAQEILKLKEKL